MIGSVVVIGLGRFGTAVAAALAARGIRVVAVDRNPQLLERAGDMFTSAVYADAADPAALRQAGASAADAVVIAVRSSLEDSMMCTLAATKLEIAEIWAAASGPKHARILSVLGAHQVILPAQHAAHQTAHRLAGRPVARMLAFGHATAVAVMTSDSVPAGFTVPALSGVVAAARVGSQIEPLVPGQTVPPDGTLLLAGPAFAIERLVEGGRR